MGLFTKNAGFLFFKSLFFFNAKPKTNSFIASIFIFCDKSDFFEKRCKEKKKKT